MLMRAYTGIIELILGRFGMKLSYDNDNTRACSHWEERQRYDGIGRSRNSHGFALTNLMGDAHGGPARTSLTALLRPRSGRDVHGSSGRTRTCNPAVNSRTLYQLSYRGTCVSARRSGHHESTRRSDREIRLTAGVGG